LSTFSRTRASRESARSGDGSSFQATSERPDDAGGADVQVGQRRLGLPRVPFGRGPQRLRIGRGGCVGNDRSDACARAFRVPRIVDERLVRARVVQHVRRCYGATGCPSPRPSFV
jgi:hypothetical protein